MLDIPRRVKCCFRRYVGSSIDLIEASMHLGGLGGESAKIVSGRPSPTGGKTMNWKQRSVIVLAAILGLFLGLRLAEFVNSIENRIDALEQK